MELRDILLTTLKEHAYDNWWAHDHPLIAYTEHGHNKDWAEAQCLDLDGWKYLVPPNDIADLVHFVFNNLSPLSLSTMANEFRESVCHAYLRTLDGSVFSKESWY